MFSDGLSRLLLKGFFYPQWVTTHNLRTTYLEKLIDIPFVSVYMPNTLRDKLASHSVTTVWRKACQLPATHMFQCLFAFQTKKANGLHSTFPRHGHRQSPIRRRVMSCERSHMPLYWRQQGHAECPIITKRSLAGIFCG